jgi:hypothetical protein
VGLPSYNQAIQVTQLARDSKCVSELQQLPELLSGTTYIQTDNQTIVVTIASLSTPMGQSQATSNT